MGLENVVSGIGVQSDWVRTPSVDPDQDRVNMETARIKYMQELFQTNGIPTECIEQLKAFEEALKVHKDRTNSYGTIWKEYGSRSPLLSAAKKMGRLMKIFWYGNGHFIDGKPQLDDAVDLLNYTAFFIRLRTEEEA